MGKVLYDLTGRALVKYLLFRRGKDARICDLRDFSDGVNGFIPARSKVVSGVEPRVTIFRPERNG